MTRKRRLRPEESELWEKVASTTVRLHPAAKVTLPEPEPPKKADPLPPPLPDFRIGERDGKRPEHRPLPLPPGERLASEPLRMDHKAFGRMKRGKLVPEARIDLHGMTLDQAHPELVRFIMTSQARGLRLVLVITGKGQRHDPHDPMPLRRGVLKHQVPQWLGLPPMKQAILQVSEAHGRHGGGGAYYVYLARRR